MSRPTPRHTFERRARIRRTIQLRRRRQIRRASALAVSLTVLVASGVAVFTIARTLGVNAKATPLYALTPEIETAAAPATIDLPEFHVEPVTVELVSESVEPQPTVEQHTNRATRTFNGRPIKPVRTIRMLVTAYSPDARSCGKFADGITASGYSVWTNGGKLVAADTRILPFGSLLSVPGYDSGEIVPVLDVGGKIKGHRLDLLFPTHAQARRWGKKWLDVTVYDYAD
jgi:3D (Asp-Asp-Asp) domain-containing protein